MAQTVSFTGLQAPFVDLKTGMVTWTWIKIIQQWQAQLATGFDSNGNLIGNIQPAVGIVGRTGTLGAILHNLSAVGVIASIGLPEATPAAQGAVVMPAGATSNVLGSAAIEPTTAFDVSGSAAAAQSAAQAFATAVANTAQSNAETFASNASHLTSGTIPVARLSGDTVTVVTAALTPTGTQGSMTFTNGIITAQVPAT